MRSKTDYPPVIAHEMNPPIGSLTGMERPSPERREFMKSLAAVAGGVFTRPSDVLQPAYHAEIPGVPGSISNTRHTKWARPLIGTGWHGHTFPGATAPFGLVQLSPDTSGPPRPW